MKYSNGTFTITKLEAKALLTFACKDQTRLRCVGFFPSNGDVCATDGYTLAVCRAAGERDGKGGFIVPRDALERAYKLMRRATDTMAVSNGSIESDGATVAYVPVDTPFPKYKPVIPRQGRGIPAQRVAINATYHARLLVVQKAAGTDGVHLYPPPGELDAYLARCGAWTVVVCPIRLDAPHAS